MLNRDQIVNRISNFMPMLETITYYSKQADGGDYTRYTIQRVRPRKAKLEDVKKNPALLAVVEKVFEVYANMLTLAAQTAGVDTPLIPTKNDYLVDAKNRAWLILHVDNALNEGVWHLFCQEEHSSD